MAFIAAIFVVGASAYSAVEQQSAARKQADAARQAAADSARQAAEAARGNALAAQTAIDRDRAQQLAQQNLLLASQQTKVVPEVQPGADANPAEAARRREVRASFSVNEGDAIGGSGSIRV